MTGGTHVRGISTLQLRLAICRPIRVGLGFLAPLLLIPKLSGQIQLPDLSSRELRKHRRSGRRCWALFPTYYTSYWPDAAPLSAKLKFRLAERSLLDPLTFGTTAAIAAVEQRHNSFPGYEQGGEGYARRFGATLADTVSQRMLSSVVFPILFHEDPRYFYQGSGTLKSRIMHALLSTVIGRTDEGTGRPSLSQVAGDFSAAALSNLYRAPQDRQAGLTIRNGFIILGGNAVANVLRELLSKKLTMSSPNVQTPKP